MKKILLLLLLINSSLMAVTQYTILVNTAQEVPMYAELFDAIHLFFHGTTGQNYLSLLKLIVMFGTIVTVVRATTAISVGVGQGGNDGAGGHSSLVGLASYQIFIVAMLMILYGRESQLIVKHPNSLRTEFTATVPEIFGYTVSFFSQLNYKMVEIAEEAFSNLRSHGTGTAYDPATANKNISYGLTGLGYGGLSSNLANISSITADKLTYLDGTDVKTIGPKLRVYGKDCVVMPLSNSNSDALGAIMNNNGSIVDNISPANMLANWGIDSSSYLTTYNGATTTCTDFWTSDLKPALDLAADNMYVRYGKEMAALFYTMKISNIVDPANDGGSNGMIGDVISMQNQIFNAGIGNTFNGIFSDLGTTGNVFAAGMQQNLMEQNMMNWGIGRAMAEYLPVFASFLFMIMIAAFPFMFAFSLMPGGISIMVNFVKTLAWISLWAPMSAILNFFMDYRLTEHIIEKTGSGTLNLVDGVSANFQLFDITSEAAMMANLAGGLYVMVPALSWMLVTGSGTMLTGITSGLASSVAGAMNMDKLQQTAEDIKTQETLDSQGIGYSERKHYEMSNRVAAQASSSMATKAAYGGAGGALTDVMAHDMGVAGATQMASQRAFGANTTMAQAAAGGEFQGAMKAGNVNGQALALSEYGNKTGDVARTGALESFGSAMTSKGKADHTTFGQVGQSSYNAGAGQAGELNEMAELSSEEAYLDGQKKGIASKVAARQNAKTMKKFGKATVEATLNASAGRASEEEISKGLSDLEEYGIDGRDGSGETALKENLSREEERKTKWSKITKEAAKKAASTRGSLAGQTEQKFADKDISDKYITAAASVAAATQISQYTGAQKVLDEHGGQAGMERDLNLNAQQQALNAHSNAKAFGELSKTELQNVRDGSYKNAANQLGKTAGVGKSTVTGDQAFKSGLNDGITAGADMAEHSKMTEKQAAKIGKQGRRFKDAQDIANSEAQEDVGNTSLKNFAKLTAGKQITAPVRGMNKAIANGWSVDTQIDDAAQNIYLQTAQAHGSAKSVRLHGVNGAANAAQASTSASMLFGSLMGAKGSGLGGPESVAKTQAISQSSNVQSQAAAQAALFEQNSMGQAATLENMAGISGAQAAASGRLEALKESNNIKDIQATAAKNFADFQNSNPAMGAYAQMKMGGGKDAIAKYAAINNMQSAMSVRAVDDLGMNHTITNNAFGRQGTSMHTGGKGMDWKATTNVDSAHMLAAETAEEHGGTSGLFATAAVHNAGTSIFEGIAGGKLGRALENTVLRNEGPNRHGSYEGGGAVRDTVNKSNHHDVARSEAREAYGEAQAAAKAAAQDAAKEAAKAAAQQRSYGNGSGHNITPSSPSYPKIITNLKGF